MLVSRIVAALALLVAIVATAAAQPGGQVFTQSPGYYPGTAKFNILCLDTTNQDACIVRSGAGMFTMGDAASPTTFSRVMFGGTTSAFPALRRNTSPGTQLDAILADASDYTTFQAKNLQATAAVSGATYLTSSRCANTGSPAVCASAAAGSVVIAGAATSVVVNTTAVTANSQVFAMIDRSLGALLSVTCDTTSDLTTGSPAITARTAATSFTIAVPVAPAANPLCLSYFIVN